MKRGIIASAATAMLLVTPVTTMASSPQSSHPSSITWAFTRAGQHPDKLLESTYAHAKRTLDIAIYSLTDYGIADAILAAKRRGVKVRIMTDKEEAANHYQREELVYLHNHGIPIMENTHTGLMHMKVSIIDHKIVTTGSYNYSESASTYNDENLVVIYDPVMAKEYETEFQTMWSDTKDYKVWSDAT